MKNSKLYKKQHSQNNCEDSEACEVYDEKKKFTKI